MNKHFVCQIKNARLMTKIKQYINQLNCINKQHIFIVLYGNDYETEMHRSMLLEKLQHIHENLCFESEIRPSNPYREMWPIDFTNKNIKSCQDCGGKFSLEVGSAELTCVNCGRIDILDGTAFSMRKTYNACTKTKKYMFKYRIHKLLDSCYYPAKLYPSQIEEACCIFEHIEDRLPKQICYPFVIYKILVKIIMKRLTTHDSKIYTNQNTGLFISKTQTKMEFHTTRPTIIEGVGA